MKIHIFGSGSLTEDNSTSEILSELQRGMRLSKCKKCGCMKEALEALRFSLSSLQTQDSSKLLQNIESWLRLIESTEYPCLGCEHCFPAVAINTFNRNFPELSKSLGCSFEIRGQTWEGNIPPVSGEYFAFCNGSDCPVAVSTLGSVGLSETLANIRPKELCIVGKTETENIGVDKVIKNVVTNPTIRFLLLVGQDSKGHRSGDTLLALWKNGVDENMKVIGSSGKRPILQNVTLEEIEAFRKQVQVVDMVGCEDTKRIVEKIRELSRESKSCSCEKRVEEIKPVEISTAPIIQAKEPAKVEMDKAGYFVIIPQPNRGIITVEHYSYDNELLRVIEGKNAKNIYWTIIKNGWVTQLSHAAYLGKEIMKAELSLKFGFKYVQDSA